MPPCELTLLRAEMAFVREALGCGPDDWPPTVARDLHARIEALTQVIADLREGVQRGHGVINDCEFDEIVGDRWRPA